MTGYLRISDLQVSFFYLFKKICKKIIYKSSHI